MWFRHLGGTRLRTRVARAFVHNGEYVFTRKSIGRKVVNNDELSDLDMTVVTLKLVTVVITANDSPWNFFAIVKTLDLVSTFVEKRTLIKVVLFASLLKRFKATTGNNVVSGENVKVKMNLY